MLSNSQKVGRRPGVDLTPYFDWLKRNHPEITSARKHGEFLSKAFLEAGLTENPPSEPGLKGWHTNGRAARDKVSEILKCARILEGQGGSWGDLVPVIEEMLGITTDRPTAPESVKDGLPESKQVAAPELQRMIDSLFTELEACEPDSGIGKLKDYADRAEAWALFVYEGQGAAQRAIAEKLLSDAVLTVEAWRESHLAPVETLFQKAMAVKSQTEAFEFDGEFGRLSFEAALKELAVWENRLERSLQRKEHELATSIAKLQTVEQWGQSAPDQDLVEIAIARMDGEPEFGDLLGEFADRLLDSDVQFDSVWDELLVTVWKRFPAPFAMELESVAATARLSFLRSFHPDGHRMLARNQPYELDWTSGLEPRDLDNLTFADLEVLQNGALRR